VFPDSPVYQTMTMAYRENALAPAADFTFAAGRKTGRCGGGVLVVGVVGEGLDDLVGIVVGSVLGLSLPQAVGASRTAATQATRTRLITG
jgi:hypothetical protein